MSDQVDAKIPEAKDVEQVGTSQRRGEVGPPPEEKRGGAVIIAGLPDTVEQIQQDRAKGFASDSSTRLLLGWSRDISTRLQIEQERTERLERKLEKSQENFSEEKRLRSLAEDRLSTHESYRPLRDLALAAGVAMVIFAAEHWDLGAAAYLMAALGLALIFGAIVSRYSKK